MTWTIRPMTATDIDAVLALEQTTIEAPHWGRSAYELCLSEENTGHFQRIGFIANDGERFAGFVIAKLVAGICEIESVAVAEGVRGRGIGQALVSAVEDWAGAHAATRLELEVRASNTRAIRLYEHSGLRREGIRSGYYDDPKEDAVLMGKGL
jgi:[ribosomal protein S18]-alanine N-acetyltransferase